MKQVRPKKNLGQHFLTDLSIAKRIADTVDEPYGSLPVLEVGPGMGVMTQYLVEKSRPFKVVEIDRESVAYLNEHFPRLRDSILGEDFLRMDLQKVFDGQQFVLTGNYPYDISSQIFFKMLDNRDLIPCCTKVQSAVIRMTRNSVEHLGCNEDLFKRVVKTVFNKRRKMLRVSLKQFGLGTFDHPFMTKRPEELAVTEFVELTNVVENAMLCANTVL